MLHTRTAGLILPVGYPDSVTPDYLAYQLWAVPSHITGWMGGSLITSSLLAAVGLKAGAGTAAAGAASIRWITKDGIGALGRLLVGGLMLCQKSLMFVCLSMFMLVDAFDCHCVCLC